MRYLEDRQDRQHPAKAQIIHDGDRAFEPLKQVHPGGKQKQAPREKTGNHGHWIKIPAVITAVLRYQQAPPVVIIKKFMDKSLAILMVDICVPRQSDDQIK